MSAAARSDDAEGALERHVGFAGSELNVDTAAIGGLLVRNVNEFIWFGL